MCVCVCVCVCVCGGVQLRLAHIAAWQAKRSAEGCAVGPVLCLIVLFHPDVLHMSSVGFSVLFGARFFVRIVARARRLEVAKGSCV